jgi:cytochrome c-type biogenesis protein CcmH
MRARRFLVLSILCACLLGASPARAVEPDEMLTDPALEQRARVLSQELRCLVCQNQSIDDSAAPLAHDLRVLVRERLKAGDTNQQVIDFLVARYGQFVLLRPRFEWETALLWLTPLVVLFAGGAAIIAALRRQNRATARADDKLSTAEEARVADLMNSARD